MYLKLWSTSLVLLLTLFTAQAYAGLEIDSAAAGPQNAPPARRSGCLISILRLAYWPINSWKKRIVVASLVGGSVAVMIPKYSTDRGESSPGIRWLTNGRDWYRKSSTENPVMSYTDAQAKALEIQERKLAYPPTEGVRLLNPRNEPSTKESK